MTRCSMTAFGIYALAVCMLLAGCGGDDGGGGGGSGGGGLATGTFIKVIEGAASGNWGGMFNGEPDSQENRYMMLFTSSEMKGSGNIRGLRFRTSETTTGSTCPNVTLKMGHTTVFALSATYDNNVNQGAGSFITVLNNAVVTIPAVTGGKYFAIYLATPFSYNGRDNLVVQLTRGAACSNNVSVDSAAAGTAKLVWAWGGAGTSTLAAGHAENETMNAQFVFAGGDNMLEYGGAMSSGGAPFGWLHARFQTMYPAAEINGSGPITGLGIKTSATTTTGAYTYTLMLGHTARSALSTTFADNYSGPPVTVVSNGTFTIPGGIPANTYIWIPFPGSFTYNGTDNLLVDLEVTTGEETNSLVYTSGVGTARFAMGWAGSGTAALGYNGNVLDQAFRFKGSTMDVLTAVNASDTYPFSDSVSPIQQCLYRQAMLGTKGSIDKIAFRLTMPSNASTYTNFQVVMGHTSASSMTATFANNMVDARTVYHGAFTVPAGKAEGDWIEIPLSSPFAYDGIRNLVVQVSADQGTATNEIAARIDARYGLSQTEHFDRTSATALSVNTQMLDQRFWLK